MERWASVPDNKRADEREQRTITGRNDRYKFFKISSLWGRRLNTACWKVNGDSTILELLRIWQQILVLKVSVGKQPDISVCPRSWAKWESEGQALGWDDVFYNRVWWLGRKCTFWSNFQTNWQKCWHRLKGVEFLKNFLNKQVKNLTTTFFRNLSTENVLENTAIPSLGGFW